MTGMLVKISHTTNTPYTLKMNYNSTPGIAMTALLCCFSLKHVKCTAFYFLSLLLTLRLFDILECIIHICLVLCRHISLFESQIYFNIKLCTNTQLFCIPQNTSMIKFQYDVDGTFVVFPHGLRFFFFHWWRR